VDESVKRPSESAFPSGPRRANKVLGDSPLDVSLGDSTGESAHRIEEGGISCGVSSENFTLGEVFSGLRLGESSEESVQ